MHSNGPQSYQGFVITPCTFHVESRVHPQGVWSIGALIRPARQSADGNRYFSQRAIAYSRHEAVERSLEFARRVIDARQADRPEAGGSDSEERDP
jgi:hypothetical protein